MLFLLIDFPQKLKLVATHDISQLSFMDTWFLLSCNGFALLTKKLKRKVTSQQMIGGNILNLIWKRMLGHFPKVPPHKRIQKSPD